MMRSIFNLMAMACVVHSAVAKVPESLTWKNFDEISDYVRLKKNDLNYQKISWFSTVIDGQREAQKQDKPLLLWLYFGDPRANC